MKYLDIPIEEYKENVIYDSDYMAVNLTQVKIPKTLDESKQKVEEAKEDIENCVHFTRCSPS